MKFKLKEQDFYLQGEQHVLNCMNDNNYSVYAKMVFKKLDDVQKINVIHDFENNPSLIEEVFLKRYDFKEQEDLKFNVLEKGYREF